MNYGRSDNLDVVLFDELRNAIANACDIMRREGLTTMDYMEQLSWLLFLKSLQGLDR